MYKKRALVLGAYLSLLALAACGPKVIDDADLVSVDYIYSFSDGTVIDEGTTEFIVGENQNNQWMESVIRGAKKDDEFIGKVNGGDLYGSEYDSNMVQSYSRLIMTEVLGIDNPKVGDQVSVSSFGEGVIVSEGLDDEGYTLYLVDFNNPKTYSELSYSIVVKNIEKR